MASAAITHDAMLRSAGIHEAIAWFDVEEDNMVTALRHAVDAPLPEVAVQLAAASGWYWTIRDRHLDAISWFDQVLPIAGGDVSDEALIVTLMGHLSRAFTGDTAWNDPSVQERRARDALAVSQLEPVGAGGHELLQVLAPLLLSFGASFGDDSWPFAVDIPNGDELGLDEWPTAILHVMRAALAENRGDVVTEGEASARALEMFERIGDQWGLALARQIRSEWLSLSGRLEEALEMTDLSSAGMRDITSAQDALQQQGLSLTILLRLGRADEAQARVQEMLDAAFSDGGSRLIVQASTLAATVALARGDLALAGAHLDLIDELAPDWPGIFPQLEASIELTRGCILLREGRLAESLAALRASAEIAIASGDHPIIAQVAIGFGELALARNEPDEAFRALELAVAIRGVLESADPRVAAILAAIGDDRNVSASLDHRGSNGAETLRTLLA
jgi:tetratricopeptide (TPR) repeat protein